MSNVVMEPQTMARSREELLSDPAIRERIAVRAYELHLERGRVPGYELQDWVQAEKEILERAAPFAQPAIGDGAAVNPEAESSEGRAASSTRRTATAAKRASTRKPKQT